MPRWRSTWPAAASGPVSVLLPSIVVAVDAASYLLSAALLRAVPQTRARGRAKLEGSYRDLLRDRPYLVFLGANAIFALCAVLAVLAAAASMVMARNRLRADRPAPEPARETQ